MCHIRSTAGRAHNLSEVRKVNGAVAPSIAGARPAVKAEYSCDGRLALEVRVWQWHGLQGYFAYKKLLPHTVGLRLGPYVGPRGVGQFLMSEVPL